MYLTVTVWSFNGLFCRSPLPSVSGVLLASCV